MTSVMKKYLKMRNHGNVHVVGKIYQVKAKILVKLILVAILDCYTEVGGEDIIFKNVKA